MSDSIKKYNEMMEEKKWVSNTTANLDFHDPIVERVINKFHSRSRDGILKYGTTLYDSPDDFYAFLNHLQEELMDACLYIETIKKQK